MALMGYVEAIEPFQVRGWVYDTVSPQRAVTVEVFLRGRLVGPTNASLYREDLEQGGVGSGDHAFIFNFDQKLEPSDIHNVSARAISSDGSFENLHAPPPSEAAPAPAKSLLRFEGPTSDSEQRPVFVLGAARSGTSAIAQALLKLSRFSGHQEGHLLDLMAHFAVALNKFYLGKFDECTADRDTMVSLVPQEYFQSTLDRAFIEIARRLFPKGMWIDKTPNSDMIHLAPRFRRIWPNSRFIFMKRRCLENAASRAAKFPSTAFAHHCREWSQVMSAWLTVKNELRGAAIEIDQKFLKENPDATASAIQQLLNLTDVEAARLCQALKFDHPQRTSSNQGSTMEISKMGWGLTELLDFEEICGRAMASFGYSTDKNYYTPGFKESRLMSV
jgi:Sulfotransferase family